MNLDQLGGQFDANKGPILATAAAGVVAFALYQRHKSGGAAAGPAQGVAVAPASAGGQTATMRGGGAYDSSASDLYGAIQPQLESLGHRLDAIPLAAPPASTPAPMAASLYGPSDSQNYVLYQDGTVAQVQQDGSQLGLNYSQWVGSGLNQKVTPTAVPQMHPGGAYYETTGNLNAVKKPATS